ncbi:GNAT family N-acetyltransferase [Micromonospora sp. WMMD980]|uniref:GNAT family N-acetyltransferase n=1 Tax=Micromonospora sp. WMMD980 TaxID=3016088 RepID=UPI002416C77A|nr:GNAT family N-acetyltransferase [Micromonospora sp. WMMD980]MDG4802300.1 GNAT family N-acetyltransferase [Micromonospora sp. WMMD980]
MVAFATRQANRLASILGALTDLYALVYAEPPYLEGPAQVARFRAGLPDEAARPGFRLVIASEDDQLVGAAYGWTMTAGTWWSQADGHPPESVRNSDKFAVMEWIVHPRHRARGIGAELMRRLLTGRPESWATLASDPRTQARDIYRRNGWREAGRSRLPWGPPMDLLILDLQASD